MFLDIYIHSGDSLRTAQGLSPWMEPAKRRRRVHFHVQPSSADVLSEQLVKAPEVYIQHMWPRALSVPAVKCLKTYCVCAVNPVCPADPVLLALI